MKRPMMLLKLLLALLFVLGGKGGTLVLAQAVQGEHVESELVAETRVAVPGETLWTALRLSHQPGWHTYWLNPGDAGKPTELRWTLPEGVTAGDILWPVPERFDLPADLVDFGYTGEVFLLVPLDIPEDFDSDTLRLQLRADWLECEDICIPAGADLSLTLPVQESGPAPPDERWRSGFAATRDEQPDPQQSLDAKFSVVSGNIILSAQSTEPVFEGLRSLTFLPAQHRVFDYLDTPVIQHQLSSVQIKQAHHRRLGERVPETVEGLLQVVRHDGSRQSYWLSARAEGVDLSSLGEFSLAGSSAASLSLPLVFFFALLGGLILNLMPCVFPVLSLKVISLVEGSQSSRREQQVHGLAYTAGVISAFLVLAVAMLLIQATGTAVGWGFHLQSPWFVAALIYLFLLMGLSLSGWLEIGTRIMGIGSDLSLQDGYRGSYFTGVLASVVASPCTAPFMGAALGFALTQHALVSLTVFVALGLGMALPFLLLSFVPALASLLPAPGRWMLTFKQVMAIPLYATVLWLLWVLSRQVALPGLLAVVASGLGLALLLVLTQRHRVRGTAMHSPLRLASWAAVALIAALLASPWLGTSALPQDTESEWYETFSESRLQALREAGDPVFVNMTASWCITCLVNERVALNSDRVREAMREAGLTYLKGDWTNNDPEITAVLKRYNTSGVPLYLMYPADPAQPARVLPQILTENTVLDAISSLNQY